MKKTDTFYVFFTDKSKALVTVWAKHLKSAPKSFRVLSENDMVHKIWSYCL